MGMKGVSDGYVVFFCFFLELYGDGNSLLL